MKLAQKLSLVTIVTGISLAVFASLLISWIVQTQLVKSIGQGRLNEGSETMMTIDRLLNERINELEIIAGDDEFAEFLYDGTASYDEVRLLLERFTQHGTFNAFLIVDKDQRIQAVSHDFPPTGIVPELNEHLLVTANALNGNTTNAPFHTSRITGEGTISIATPVIYNDNGNEIIVGALLGEVDWTEVTQSIGTDNDIHYSYLLTETGEVIASNTVNGTSLMSPEVVLEKALSGVSGYEVTEIGDLGNVLCVIIQQQGYGSFYGYNWKFVTISPAQEAFAAIRVVTLSVAGIVIAFTLTTVLFTLLLISRFVIHPLDKLSDVMEDVEDGDLDQRVDIHSKDELEEVAMSFNHMTATIKEKEELIKRERNRLALILHSIGDAVVVIDAEEKIVLMNPVAEKYLNVQEEQVIGKEYTQFVQFANEGTLKPNTDFIDLSLKHGVLASAETNLVLLRGTSSPPLPVNETAAPLVDEKANTFGAVIVFRDVTKEREVDRMKTEFISVASHQLKTPLNRMRWFLELLSGGEIGVVKPEHVDLVQELVVSNKRMIMLITDLLNISRIDRGEGIVLDRKTFKLRDFLDSSVKEFKHLAEQSGQELQVDYRAAEQIDLFADELKLFESIKNLITNALKYSPKQSKIKLSAQKIEGENVLFSVKDNGIGIPKDEQEHIFERFFRATNASRSNTEGTGLGLSVTKSFVEAHGGKIWFESEPGAGTTFYISLPIDLEN